MLKRFMVASCMLFLLTGCASVVAVGGAVSELVVDNFKGMESSMPVKMDVAMAAVQQGLKGTDFSADVVEFLEDGYLVYFVNGELEGLIQLSKQTEGLTTLYIRVKSASGVVREESVEETVLDVIAKQAKYMNKKAHFKYSGYNYIRSEPSRFSEKLGRYKRGAKLKLSRSSNKAWLKFKMPSGKKAFLKGKLPVKKRI